MSKIRVGKFIYLDVETFDIYSMNEASKLKRSKLKHSFGKDGKVNLKSVYDFVCEGDNQVKNTEKIEHDIFGKFVSYCDDEDIFDLDNKLFGEHIGEFSDKFKAVIHIFDCKELNMVMVRFSKNKLYIRTFFSKDSHVDIIDYVAHKCLGMYKRKIIFDIKRNITNYYKTKNPNDLFENNLYDRNE